MQLDDHEEPKKTDDEDEEDEDEEDEDEDEEDDDDDDDDDEADWAQCTKCERALALNASVRLYMSRGRMTAENFVCELCAAEKLASIRDKKAKRKGTAG